MRWSGPAPRGPPAQAGADRARRSPWRRVPPGARAERLWRPAPVGAPAQLAVHRDVLPQHHQVPTFARLPADDAGADSSAAGGGGKAARYSSVRAGGLRARAFLLLRAAPLPDPRGSFGAGNLDRDRSGAASDRLAALPQLVRHPARRRLSGLAPGPGGALPGMQLVCAPQGDPARLVAGLSLIQSGWSLDQRSSSSTSVAAYPARLAVSRRADAPRCGASVSSSGA